MRVSEFALPHLHRDWAHPRKWQEGNAPTAPPEASPSWRWPLLPRLGRDLLLMARARPPWLLQRQARTQQAEDRRLVVALGLLLMARQRTIKRQAATQRTTCDALRPPLPHLLGTARTTCDAPGACSAADRAGGPALSSSSSESIFRRLLQWQTSTEPMSQWVAVAALRNAPIRP